MSGLDGLGWPSERPTPITDELWVRLVRNAAPRNSLIIANHARNLERQLAEVTEQRDRLAEAIERHQTTLPYPPEFEDFKLYSSLAAVKGESS